MTVRVYVKSVFVVSRGGVPEAEGVVENAGVGAEGVEKTPVVHDLVDVVDILNVVGAQISAAVSVDEAVGGLLHGGDEPALEEGP